MTARTAQQTVKQAIADFDEIKDAIEWHKIKVPYATPTSKYAELISQIRVGSISGGVRIHPKGKCFKAIHGNMEVINNVTENQNGE